ncbi:MAG: zf-HC2 domain-containing protein [Oscillospiraceae bacterium]|nr:zf-HC2 domain-containing protein [Oscillospiraceae bacterium]
MTSYNCELYMDLMPLVKDGAASEASRRAVEEHIALCENCRALYESLPAPEEDGSDAEALKKIRRRLALSGWLVMLAASILGAFLTMTEGMGYNLILFPAVGILAYCVLGKEAWKGSLPVAVFSFLWLAVRMLLPDSGFAASQILSAFGFCLCYGVAFCVGVGLAWLVHYTFTRPGEGSRGKRVGAGLLALGLCGLVFWFCDSFLGNPIASAAVVAHAEGYLEEKYPNLELIAGEPRFDWYSGGHYELDVYSPISGDTWFMLQYDRLGRLSWDGYETYVESGANTLERLNCAVQVLLLDSCDRLEQELGCGVYFSLASVGPSVYDGVIDYPFWPEERVDPAELEVDGTYSAWALAARYGTVEFSAEVEEAAEEEMAILLRRLHEILSEEGVRIATVDAQIYDREGNSLKIAGFPYENIEKETLPELVHQAAQAWEQFEKDYEATLADKNA